MRRFVWLVFLFALLVQFFCFPARSEASFEVRVYSDEENLIGELWNGNEVFWRVGILPHGALRVSDAGERFHLILIPSVEGGFFSFHVQ